LLAYVALARILDSSTTASSKNVLLSS